MAARSRSVVEERGRGVVEGREEEDRGGVGVLIYQILHHYLRIITSKER